MPVVGQYREGVHLVSVQLEGLLTGTVEEPHPDGLIARTAEEALADRHAFTWPVCLRRSRRLLLVTLHTLASISCVPPLMMCWQSRVAANPSTAQLCAEKV